MRSVLRNAFKIGLFAAGSAIFIAGCTKKQTEQNRFPRSETLQVNLTTEPPTIDWTKANDIVSFNVAANIMEPLIAMDFSQKPIGIKPALFTSWMGSKDLKKWTFQLRKGVRWSDGVMLTSQHVVDGFRRLLNPKTAAEGAQFIYSIENAEVFHTGNIDAFDKVGVRAVAPYTIEISLQEPLSFFPKVLTGVNTMPVRMDLIEKYEDQWTDPENLVTLGAYQLKTWKHDDYILLERNPSYYGPPAHIPYVLGRMITDTGTAIELFEDGKLDLQDGISPIHEKRFLGRPEMVTHPMLAIFYMCFNIKKKPFDSMKIRQAFVHAIDRSQIITLLGGKRRLNTAWLPDGLLGAMQNSGLEFDIVRAKQLLSEAGIKNPKDLGRIRLEGNASESHLILYQNIQAQLKKNLGIDIEIATEEWKTYLQSVKTDPAPLFRMGWISMYPDPHFLMSLFHSDSNFNYTGWTSKKYDQLIEKAAREKDEIQRAEMYKRAQSILIEEAPIFTIYTGSNQYLVSKRVKEFRPNALDRLIFKEMKLEGHEFY